MGHLNLAESKRHGLQWRLLDLVLAALFLTVFVFFLLVFTPLGDSLATSCRRSLALSNAADPRQRERLLAVVDSAGHQAAEVEAWMADAADHMPCEDPRRKFRFIRDMNYDREHHCPVPGEEPLCLVPLPDGYRIPVPWPESLRKVIELPIKHPELFESLGIAQPKAVRHAKDVDTGETEVGSTISVVDTIGAESNLQTVQTKEAMQCNLKFVWGAVAVILISVLAVYLFQHECCPF